MLQCYIMHALIETGTGPYGRILKENFTKIYVTQDQPHVTSRH